MSNETQTISGETLSSIKRIHNGDARRAALLAGIAALARDAAAAKGQTAKYTKMVNEAHAKALRSMYDESLSPSVRS